MIKKAVVEEGKTPCVMCGGKSDVIKNGEAVSEKDKEKLTKDLKKIANKL